MRGTVLYGPRDIRFEDRETPKIVEPTDAVIRVAATCVCGSDLWPYRGIQQISGPTPIGHEYAASSKRSAASCARSGRVSSSLGRSPRLITRARTASTATSIATGRTEQLRFHIPNALKNGMTRDEVIEVITHLAFYSGWPNAMSALQLAKELLTKEDAGG
jgi:hypothetical protein